MPLYPQPNIKTSANEANLAALNSERASGTNTFVTEEQLGEFGSGNALQRTGTEISFDKDAYYNTLDSPGTGNITAVLTGAILGVTGCILHNSDSEPTFGSGFVKLSSSGNYTLSVLNYIYYNYISDTEIVYTISQEA